jgi:O-antigen/teichoic acid export membrane protein
MKYMRGNRLVLYAAVTIQATALIRGAAVARALGPEQFGIAAAVILIIQFLDASADVGLNKFLISNREGARRSFQETVQFISLLRGSITAFLIMVCSGPALSLLGAEFSLVAGLLLASAPLFSAMMHFDVVRYQRRGHLGHYFTCLAAGEMIGLAVACVVAYTTHSYVAVLAGWSARSAGLAVMSHALANRRYSIKLNRNVASQLIRYSAPLAVNGPLLFASAQADKAVLLALVGPSQFGIYAVVMMLLASPSAILVKVIGSNFLPKLSEDFNKGIFPGRERLLRSTTMLLSTSLLGGVAVVGAAAIPFIFGAEFTVKPELVAAAAALQATRLMRVWVSTVALAAAETRLILYGSVLRLVGLPFAALASLMGYDLPWLVLAFWAGEFLALLTSAFLLRKRLAFLESLGSLAGAFAFTALTVVAVSSYHGLLSWALTLGGYCATALLYGRPLLASIRLKSKIGD